MKTPTTQSKSESKRGLASRLNMASWSKHYVATMTADEEAWPQREQPSGNLGRIFVLLLLLHVFIIGAVVIYNIITPKSSSVAKTEQVPAALDKTKLATGSKIVTTPRSAAPGTTNVSPAVTTENKQPEYGSYEVRSGDNVPGIVAKLGITADDLVKENNLDSTELFPGRKLRYQKKPALQAVVLNPTQAVTFPISTGGTKPNSMKVSTPSSLSDNLPKINNSTVTGGDSLPKAILIKGPSDARADTPPAPLSKSKDDTGTSAKPKSDSNKSAKTTAAKTAKDTAGKRTYVTTSKDTLYSVAKKYGVKVSALQKANDIKDPTTLKGGTRLIIPSKN